MPASLQASEPSPPAVSEPPRKSPWGLKANIGRVLWDLTCWLVWKRTPRSWTGLRNGILRLFRARLGHGVAIDPSVRIDIPWHLTVHDDTRVCEGAILYCLGHVSIGRHCLIGPFAHLCAGTHDYKSPKFTLLRPPITIEDNCVLLSASFVAPGVTIASDCVIQERAGVYRNTRSGMVYAGNPAVPVGPRSTSPDQEAS